MIIAVAHHAGGVGKTHVTLNLGYSLAARGRRVLLVDMDPQADLSTRLEVEPGLMRLQDALLSTNIVPTVQACNWGKVWLGVLPTTLDMAGTELRLVAEQAREQRLTQVLRRWRDQYDYILIDCPPSLSVLTQNALYAADTVLIPVQAQHKAYNAIPNLIASIFQVNTYRAAQPLDVLGILFTMVERNNMARNVLEAAREAYPDMVFATTIPAHVAARYEGLYHAPVGAYDPGSPVANAYATLAEEVLSRAESPVHS